MSAIASPIANPVLCGGNSVHTLNWMGRSREWIMSCRVESSEWITSAIENLPPTIPFHLTRSIDVLLDLPCCCRSDLQVATPRPGGDQATE